VKKNPAVQLETTKTKTKGKTTTEATNKSWKQIKWIFSAWFILYNSIKTRKLDCSSPGICNICYVSITI